MPFETQNACPMRSRAPALIASALLVLVGTVLPPPASAATDDAPYRSAMDAPLLFQLLIGELELNAGRAAQAFEVVIDAARRTRDESLFKRAVQIAIQNRSSDQMQSAVRGWRQALPQSIEAIRYQLQIALALGRTPDAVEPFTALIDRSPPNERAGVINALPQLLERATDRKLAVNTFEPLLRQNAQLPALRTASMAALGRLWLAAGDAPHALELAEQAHAGDPLAREPALLALDIMPRTAAAEKVTQSYLAQAGADPMVRLAYGQTLAQMQRHTDALPVLQRVVTDRPETAPAWLTIAALHLEMKRPKEAEGALQRYLQVTGEAQPAAPQASASAARAVPTSTDDASSANHSAATTAEIAEAMANAGAMRAQATAAGRNQAFLMMSQAAEQRGDLTAAAAWLERVEGASRGIDVATRRATLMAKQGKLVEARAQIRNLPETGPDDARLKFVAESQVLRDVKRWQDAHDVLAQGVTRFPDDTDMIYEQAMMAEKVNRLADMERLLRKVMLIKPEHHHAYNALGYSLADRGLRLDEAKQLVRKALDLAPGDPFITDSMAWVEFRQGNRAEALKLLKQAWAARPDTEIGAHLGEVLWATGDKDEARRIWRESKARDGSNDVLQETLKRLKVDL